MLDKFKDELFKSVGVFFMDIDICYGSPTLYNLGEQLRGGCCHHNSGFGVVPVILVETHLVQLVCMLRVLLAIGIIKLVFQRSVLLEPLHRWLEAFFFVNDRRQKLLAVTLIVWYSHLLKLISGQHVVSNSNFWVSLTIFLFVFEMVYFWRNIQLFLGANNWNVHAWFRKSLKVVLVVSSMLLEFIHAVVWCLTSQMFKYFNVFNMETLVWASNHRLVTRFWGDQFRFGWSWSRRPRIWTWWPSNLIVFEENIAPIHIQIHILVLRLLEMWSLNNLYHFWRHPSTLVLNYGPNIWAFRGGHKLLPSLI